MDQPPTPEELQFISNVAHWIEGGLVGTVALICLAEVLGYGKSRFAPYLWPGLVVGTGLFLPLYLLLQNGLDEVSDSAKLILVDPQQRKHLLMAFLLLCAGTVEALRRGRILVSDRWKFVWPIMIIALGGLFTVHTQKGTPEALAWSRAMHRYLGAILILAGAFKAAEVLWGRKLKWLAFTWILLLLAAAAFLISYREPDRAFRTDSPENAKPEARLRLTQMGTIQSDLSI